MISNHIPNLKTYSNILKNESFPNSSDVDEISEDQFPLSNKSLDIKIKKVQQTAKIPRFLFNSPKKRKVTPLSETEVLKEQIDNLYTQQSQHVKTFISSLIFHKRNHK